MIVFKERGIAVDARIVSLANNQIRAVLLQLHMELCAHAALNTVVRPKNLWPIRHINHVVRAPALMRRGKRGMARRVPVLCQDDRIKISHQRIDTLHNCITLRHSKCAARAKIVLNVDHNERLHGVSFRQNEV